MATETEWSCPMCHNNQDDIAYMSPCLHQLCLGCALRWARQKSNCPVCRSRTTTILYSLWSDDDYLTFDVPGPAEPVAEDHQDRCGAAGPVPGAQVGIFPPEVWADFFKSHPNSIRPLLLWLQRELGVLFEDQWWEVAAAEGIIVSHLCHWGLHEEVLVQKVQNFLPAHPGTFVRQLITTAMHLYGREIHQHVGQQDPHAARGEDDSPATRPSPTTSRGGNPDSSLASSSSPEGYNREEEASTLEAAHHGRPGCPSAPVPAEQELPQEESGQAAVAGPSAQACSHSPSAPGQGWDRLPGGPRCPRKRRAPSPQDSPQPRKRPSRRRH
ncbi:TOPRS ligase, partial [Cochlearius cochlearius]|nr:TOPRS ligase [Cochlearius cochlearius]